MKIKQLDYWSYNIIIDFFFSVEKVKELTEEVNKLKEQVKAAEDAKSELEAQNNKVFIINKNK